MGDQVDFCGDIPHSSLCRDHPAFCTTHDSKRDNLRVLQFQQSPFLREFCCDVGRWAHDFLEPDK